MLKLFLSLFLISTTFVFAIKFEQVQQAQQIQQVQQTQQVQQVQQAQQIQQVQVTQSPPVQSLPPITSVKSTIPKHSIDLYNTDFKARDVGTGAEGDVYVVGSDGLLYIYDFISDTYILIDSPEIPTLARVDTDSDATPYVITTSVGQIYYLNCNNQWVHYQDVEQTLELVEEVKSGKPAVIAEMVVSNMETQL